MVKRSKTKKKSKTKVRSKSYYWIQEARFKKGTMRVYVKNNYGSKGFNKDGTLKMGVLEEIANDPTVRSKTRKRAVAAMTLKRISEENR